VNAGKERRIALRQETVRWRFEYVRGVQESRRTEPRIESDTPTRFASSRARPLLNCAE
jgi:hypothetical protein